ncbi:unnamed protein product [Caenorhabditis auriculariae]|uniref:Uncharacterized protein n=1 Tax=Caenorhabditis auriculariae TaxID=2777116 RepID=A0A8S1HGQ2_9PELO|nr:unnamed protein product [Caenorhabditis auriculariae]
MNGVPVQKPRKVTIGKGKVTDESNTFQGWAAFADAWGQKSRGTIKRPADGGRVCGSWRSQTTREDQPYKEMKPRGRSQLWKRDKKINCSEFRVKSDSAKLKVTVRESPGNGMF